MREKSLFNKYDNDLIDKEHFLDIFINDAHKFEILSEEDEEIDIDSIKETNVDKNGYLQTHLGAFKGRKMDLAFNDRVNELIKAVKQLNKQMKEK